MSFPKFTAEASIGNHESYVDAKGKYKKYDSSLKIEPAQELYEHCIADGCVSTPDGKICRGWNCIRYGFGGSILYTYYQHGWHFIHNDWGPISEP